MGASPPTLPGGRSQGFTLMEVLIAVTITAVIGLGVWQVLSGVINSRERVNSVAGEFDTLQRAFLLLERDISQAVNRPVRNLYGDFEPALSSRSERYQLMLTRQGWRNPLGNRRSELQRSQYEYTGEALIRHYWLTVDQGQEDESRSQTLLEDVTDFEVRFMNQQGTWVDNWPPEDQGTPMQGAAQAPYQPFPRGIELTLEHRRFGELSRVFSLPDFDRSQAQGAVSAGNESTGPTDGADPEDDGEEPASESPGVPQ